MTRIFNTLAGPCQHCYEEKRSRFIAHIWPVASKEQGFAYLEQVKLSFPDARHYCWAYLLGDPQQALTAGFNDDGEPGGTAGKPMLHVLTQRQVGDVFAVVVRYFGGIKLGAGGLTRAYGQAISKALDLAQLQQVVPHCTIQIRTDFAFENRVRQLLPQFDVQVHSATYQQRVHLTCQCPQHLFAELSDALQEQTAGNTLCVLQD